MRGVESFDRLGGHAFVDGTMRQLHAYFARLAEIPEVGAPPDADLIVGETFVPQRRAGERLKVPEALFDARVLEAIVTLNERLDVVVLDVDHEQTERRDVAGGGRD